MSNSIAAFNEGLQQIIRLAASEEGNESTLPSKFTEHMFEVLGDAGEVDDAQLAVYEARGARASGYELSEDEGTLNMFITDYRSDLGVQTLGKSDLETSFRRLVGFVEQAKEGLWRKLEDTSSGWDMAQRLDEVWPRVGEIRLFLLSNAELRSPVPDVQDLEGRPLHFHVWDLDRLHKLNTSGRVQEPITIDLEELWGEPVPCLGPQGEAGVYEAYLVALPGELLARIYETYGPRLLELNVRSFLQSRGKVNRGIQETIRDEPERFLAYNNGISMTASGVEILTTADGGRGLSKIHDLQIVNGGQTTASLHFAKVKNKADLSDLFIQAKLSVVEPSQLESLVPRISQFANSQNRVNMADFSANDPFHVELEKLSRSVWAPGKSGGPTMTRWFYERARGQYADAHASERTPAKQREFKKVHPLNQKFTKTDLAKFENTWDQLPWLVAWGNEKNFREFMLRIDKRGGLKPSIDYFESLVAKAILFRTTEKLIGALQLGGYRASAVTYTLAKLLNVTGQRVDLGVIWKSQEVSTALSSDITDLAAIVHSALLKSAGTRNVSEWAKRQDCWSAIQEIEWSPSAVLKSELVSAGQRTRVTSESSVTEMLNDDEKVAMDAVVAISSEAWFEISQWAKQTDNLLPWQRGLAFSLGKLAGSGKAPSRKQANHGEKIYAEATRLGFSPSAE